MIGSLGSRLGLMIGSLGLLAMAVAKASQLKVASVAHARGTPATTGNNARYT
jgi:hypothetical protein